MGNLVCICVWKKSKTTYWREIGEDVLHKIHFLCGPAHKKGIIKEMLTFLRFYGIIYIENKKERRLPNERYEYGTPNLPSL